MYQDLIRNELETAQKALADFLADQANIESI